MAFTLAPQDVADIDAFLAEAGNYVFNRKDRKEFDGIDFALDLWQPSESISIWLGCHATESIRKEWDRKVEKVRKTSVRIERMRQYLERVSPELRTSERANRLLNERFGILDWYLAEFHSFWVTLKRAYNVEDGRTPPIGQSKPVEVSDSQRSPSESVPNEYQRLWDYAQKMWARGTAKYKICECMKNGPGDYLDCLQLLAPGVNRTDQSRQFHSVVGALNGVVKVELRLEVYKVGQQILLCEAGQRPTRKKPIAKRPTTKKSSTKRKRR